MNTLPDNHHYDSCFVIDYLHEMRIKGKLSEVAERWGYKEKTLCRVSYGCCVNRKMVEKYKEER